MRRLSDPALTEVIMRSLSLGAIGGSGVDWYMISRSLKLECEQNVRLLFELRNAVSCPCELSG